MADKAQIICGFDPGLRRTGYGVLRLQPDDTTELIEAGVIRPSRETSLGIRLAELAAGVDEVLGEYAVTVVAVEEIYSHYLRPRTAIIMAHARGVILLEAARQNLELVHLPATTIKKHVSGNGRASKEQVQRAVVRALSLSQVPEPPDVADALAIALTACAIIRQPARLSGLRDDLLIT